MRVARWRCPKSNAIHSTLCDSSRCHGFWSLLFVTHLVWAQLDLLAAQTFTDLVGNQTSNPKPAGNASVAFVHSVNCSCDTGWDCSHPANPCPSGPCPEGWVQTPKSGRCTPLVVLKKQKQISDFTDDRGRPDTKELPETKSAAFVRDLYHHSRPEKNNSQNQYALKIHPIEVCQELGNNYFIKLWKIWLPAQYFVKSLDLHVKRAWNSLEFPYLSVSLFPDYHTDFVCRKTSDFRCSVRFKSLAITDFLLVVTKESPDQCALVSLDPSVLHGLPICPYLHWGPTCQRPCDCACGQTDCHPLTGRCGQRVHACRPGQYGKFCDRKCPPRCDVGAIGGCHVISGGCKACALATSASHFKNQNCTLKSLTGFPKAARPKLKLRCRRSRFVFFRKEVPTSKVVDYSNRTRASPGQRRPMSMRDIQLTGLVLVGAVGAVILAVVLVLCGWIVWRVVKKRDLRQEHVTLMNQRYQERMSLKTIGDFDVEFQEMMENLQIRADGGPRTSSERGSKSTGGV